MQGPSISTQDKISLLLESRRLRELAKNAEKEKTGGEPGDAQAASSKEIDDAAMEDGESRDKSDDRDHEEEEEEEEMDDDDADEDDEAAHEEEGEVEEPLPVPSRKVTVDELEEGDEADDAAYNEAERRKAEFFADMPAVRRPHQSTLLFPPLILNSVFRLLLPL